MFDAPAFGQGEVNIFAMAQLQGDSTRRVIVIGLGAIGALALEECLRDQDFLVVNAVDPRRSGERVEHLQVQDRLAECFDTPADVALFATGSSLGDAEADFRLALEFGLDVVSTCEELSYPWARHFALASELDELALRTGRRILGCGVNPGFVMDVIPVILTTASLRPTSIIVTRCVNLHNRRPQLQNKLGVGLSGDEWLAGAADGNFGHRGLVESAYLCALGANWNVREVAFQRDPILESGIVVGVVERATLEAEGDRLLDLSLTFQLEATEIDAVEIQGSPHVSVQFNQGLHGDWATVARMLNGARRVQGLAPGIRLPTEVPPWSYQDQRKAIAVHRALSEQQER